jgi:hypothetical protein
MMIDIHSVIPVLIQTCRHLLYLTFPYLPSSCSGGPSTLADNISVRESKENESYDRAETDADFSRAEISANVHRRQQSRDRLIQITLFLHLCPRRVPPPPLLSSALPLYFSLCLRSALFTDLPPMALSSACVIQQDRRSVVSDPGTGPRRCGLW